MENTTDANRRRDPRADVYHPIRFKLFSRDVATPPSDGYLKDLSVSGARVGLDDQYGQFSRKTLAGLRTKLNITLPEGDTLQLLCVVCWAKPAGATESSEFEIGLKFVDIEPWQLEKIQQFLSSRHNDQTMLWNMWDAYQQGAGQ
jgi:c-di-GMP-binding flagellar brake protein YcgR